MQRDEPHGESAVSLAELLDLLRRSARRLLIGGVLGALVGLLFLSTREPQYRVHATLLLDSDQAQGVLGELAALTSAPKAASEMELLRSRSTAEAVVDGRSASGEERGYGLTTLVEHERYRPLAHLAQSLGDDEWELLAEKPRLRARVAPDARLLRQPTVLVEFLGADRVRLSRDRALNRLGLGGAEPAEFDLVLGARIDYAGLGLWLEPEGDLAGERFRLVTLAREDAIERVMKRTRVNETERNSGVIQVVYDDTDPGRAAETANALCAVYLERNQQRSEKRASHTVEFIHGQLEEQLEMLEGAEREVVELQQQNPKTVDLGATGQALIARLSALEVEKVAARLQRTGLEEALELLRAGDFASLSRLGPDLADPIARGYVERIAELGTEAELLERADAGTYKGLVQAKALELDGEADALGVKAASLRFVVGALEEGDTSILGSLVATEQAGARDPLLESWLARWSTVQDRLTELAVEFTDELPEVRTLRAQGAELEGRILDLLRGRLAGFEAQRDEYAALAERYGERADLLPAQERERIDAARASLTASTLAHLTARLAGLRAQEDGLARETASVEENLAQLPEEERVLADPTRRLEAHSEIVKFLLGRQQEAEISRAGSLATAEVIDAAVPAREPRGPLVPLYLLVGAMLGSGCALAWALLHHSVDGGVFSAAELELASGLSVLGSVPDFRRGPCKVRGVGRHFVALRDDPGGPIAEAYRSLRSNLKFLLHGAGRPLETLAFTSCTQGEGKSVTNVDMALAFALAGKRVLLVDADMRRPAVSELLQLSRSPGLSDVLRGDRDWRECVQAEVRPGLDVLPAGPQPRSPGDLFAGPNTARFVDDVRGAYDLVVFDVPPALAVADIDCLAPLLDALVLVARSGKLSQNVVQEGTRRLRGVGARLVGAVLNAAQPSRGEQKYGYGYGYGYGARESAHEEAA